MARQASGLTGLFTIIFFAGGRDEFLAMIVEVCFE